MSLASLYSLRPGSYDTASADTRAHAQALAVAMYWHLAKPVGGFASDPE